MKSARQLREERKAERAAKRRRRQSWAGVAGDSADLAVERVWVNEKLLGPHGHWNSPNFLDRGYYEDLPFTCRDCGKEEVWTATQQKWWYEIAKGDVFTSASRCRACRRKAHERKEEQRGKLRESLGPKTDTKTDDTAMTQMIPCTEQDDFRFIRMLRNILGNSLRLEPPREAYVVRIDGWFDAKWRNFSAKVLGAVACRRYAEATTLPPFHPHRVLEESHWMPGPGERGWQKTPAAPLHIEQESAQNLRRPITRISSSAIFFWYTAGSSSQDRGSAMLYRVHDGQLHTWHAGFWSERGWTLGHHKGISSAEIKMLME